MLHRRGDRRQRLPSSDGPCVRSLRIPTPLHVKGRACTRQSSLPGCLAGIVLLALTIRLDRGWLGAPPDLEEDGTTPEDVARRRCHLRARGDTGAVPLAPVAVAQATSRAHADLVALLVVQRATSRPALVASARVLGQLGEHASVWLALGTGGALLDRSRRARWLEATAVVVAAHARSIVLKRVARRSRPQHAGLLVHGPAGRWSFPSSHAASTTAAATAFGTLLGRRWTAALPPAMALSRMVLGVHTPTDVLAGMAVGAATARAHARSADRRGVRV